MSSPAEVFDPAKLKKGGQIKELWPIQREALEFYSRNFLERNRVAIELPTGSGKSVIALLILEFWRQKGKRVAIVTSSIALSLDLARRCQDLGFDGVVITGHQGSEMEERARIQNIRKYSRRLSIGIMNYWSYMLGKDIPIPDVLIIDDADSFENLLLDYFGLTISRWQDEDLWNQVMYELSKIPIYRSKIDGLREIDNPEGSVLIYFTHSIKMAEFVSKIIHSNKSSVSRNLSFSFQRNKDKFHSYLMFVSKDEISFTPLIPPASNHERLKPVQHVIYMSATLGSEEILRRTLGIVDDLSILDERSIKASSGTMGRRLIFPLDSLTSSRDVERVLLSTIGEIMNKFGKAVILCTSNFEADKVIRYLETRYKTIKYTRESDVEEFKGLGSGALVTGGRFIGLDLPGDTCRVAIIPRLPFVLSPIDAFVRDILDDNSYVNEKVSRRLVQACGRCNRGPDDYAAYYVLDGRLAADARGELKIFQHLPKKMRAELDYGQEFSEIGGLSKTLEVGELLVKDRLPKFEKELGAHLQIAEIPKDPQIARPYKLEVRAWHDLSDRLNYRDALDSFRKAIKHYDDLPDGDLRNRLCAWMNYLAAFCSYLAYTLHTDPSYATVTVEHLNRAVKMGQTSWFSGVQVVLNELKQETQKSEDVIYNVETIDFREKVILNLREFVRHKNPRKYTPRQAWDELRSKILNGRHGQVVDALKILLGIIGFDARRTDDEVGQPDILLFATLKSRYLVLVEVKTKEQAGTEVGVSDIDQIGGHKASYVKQYGDRTIYPVLITNRDKISESAVSKSLGYVKIIKAGEISLLMNGYLDLIERVVKVQSSYENGRMMAGIPTSDKLEALFNPSTSGVLTPDEIDRALA